MALKELAPIIEAIDKEIRNHLRARSPLAQEVGEYILKSGGKKIRPLLFVLSARLCGEQSGRELKLAPIFEYLHVATLLHDDVIDGACLRRGKPSANAVWGNTIPILVGDFLLASALELAASSGNLKMVEVLSQTTSFLAQGEIQEIVKANHLELSEEEYYEIIKGKTAVLIGAATRLGAVLANAFAERENRLQHYGYNLGMAFQIMDDVLDYIGNEEEFGKPVGHDLLEGKVTLPLIYALREATSSEREQIGRCFNRKHKEDIDFIIDFVRAKGGPQKAISRAKELINKAKQALAPFPGGFVKDSLLEIADFVIERRF